MSVSTETAYALYYRPRKKALIRSPQRRRDDRSQKCGHSGPVLSKRLNAEAVAAPQLPPWSGGAAERAAAAVHEHKLVRTKLSSLAEGVLSRIINFRQSASDADRIILVFAAEDALSDEHRRTLEDVKAMGREACWSGLRC